jgi:hypothetical protein
MTARSRCGFRTSFAGTVPPSHPEGAGNAGRPMRPPQRVRRSKVKSTRVSQVTPESPGIPRAVVLTASFVLSPATGLSCHRRPRKKFRELDASVGASGPHDFSVRFRTVRYRRFHVHRIPSRVRDDRETPLCGTLDFNNYIIITISYEFGVQASVQFTIEQRDMLMDILG